MTLIRTDSFVPLISTASNASSERANFQATILPQPDHAQKFQAAEASAPASPAHAACEPRVSVHRDGDRISGIHIQCSCGQVINLACVYQPEAAAPKT